MRLLDSVTRQLKEFIGDDNVPPYAILSHTWGDDEVSYQGMLEPNVEAKAGYRKIQYCCDQAVEDGLQWAWVDTCCIDKSSSAELSENINSMFRYYSKAKVCYAYLADVSLDYVSMIPRSRQPMVTGTILGFPNSRWFTRGWTLQELLAPLNVIFYSYEWHEIGTKESLCSEISEITGISSQMLLENDLDSASVATRMSWASKRTTTRVEDMAYSLLGLFDINMPLLYGEGEKAFIRLQEEILKISSDQSLFAWGDFTNPGSKPLITMEAFQDAERKRVSISRQIVPTVDKTFRKGNEWRPPLLGLLAQSPAEFANSRDVDCIEDWIPHDVPPAIVVNRGVRIDLPLLPTERMNLCFAVLGCYLQNPRSGPGYIGIPLRALGADGSFGRFRELVHIRVPSEQSYKMDIRNHRTTLFIIPKKHNLRRSIYKIWVMKLELKKDGYCFSESCRIQSAIFDDFTGFIPDESVSGAQAAFLFTGHAKKTLGVAVGRFSGVDSKGPKGIWVHCDLARSQTAAEFLKHLIETGYSPSHSEWERHRGLMSEQNIDETSRLVVRLAVEGDQQIWKPEAGQWVVHLKICSRPSFSISPV